MSSFLTSETFDHLIYRQCLSNDLTDVKRLYRRDNHRAFSDTALSITHYSQLVNPTVYATTVAVFQCTFSKCSNMVVDYLRTGGIYRGFGCLVPKTQNFVFRGFIPQVQMWDEIFKFESFINFVNFFKYFKTPFLKFSLKFCIFIIIHQ